jgi:hypothetical protein
MLSVDVDPKCPWIFVQKAALGRPLKVTYLPSSDSISSISFWALFDPLLARGPIPVCLTRPSILQNSAHTKNLDKPKTSIGV